MENKSITIKFKNNGWEVVSQGMTLRSGEYVYKSTEGLQMLEAIGESVWGTKIEVRVK